MTFLLMLIKIYGGLRPLSKTVDYRLMYNDPKIKMPKETIWTLGATASDVVELACTTYVSLLGGEPNAGIARKG